LLYLYSFWNCNASYFKHNFNYYIYIIIVIIVVLLYRYNIIQYNYIHIDWWINKKWFYYSLLISCLIKSIRLIVRKCLFKTIINIYLCLQNLYNNTWILCFLSSCMRRLIATSCINSAGATKSRSVSCKSNGVVRRLRAFNSKFAIATGKRWRNHSGNATDTKGSRSSSRP
jgi:hypothetical protein